MSFVAQGLSLGWWPGLALIRKQRGELRRSWSEAPGCSRSVGNPAGWNKGFCNSNHFQLVLPVLREDGQLRAGTTGYGFYLWPIQGLLGRNPKLFARSAISSFFCKSGATCRYPCVSSRAGVRLAGSVLVHVLPFLPPLPAAPSDIVVWLWIWEPPCRQSLQQPPLSAWGQYITNLLRGSGRELRSETDTGTIEMLKTCQKSSRVSGTAFSFGTEVIINMASIWHSRCVRMAAENRDINLVLRRALFWGVCWQPAEVMLGKEHKPWKRVGWNWRNSNEREKRTWGSLSFAFETENPNFVEYLLSAVIKGKKLGQTGVEGMGGASGWHLSSWASKLEVRGEGIAEIPEAQYHDWESTEIAVEVKSFEREGLACW